MEILRRCECFERKTIKSIFTRMVVDRFDFDMAFPFIAQKYDLEIKEVPVE